MESPQQARKWWTGEIARIVNAQEAEPASLISTVDVAAVVERVESGVLNDRLARQVVENPIAGRARRPR